MCVKVAGVGEVGLVWGITIFCYTAGGGVMKKILVRLRGGGVVKFC